MRNHSIDSRGIAKAAAIIRNGGIVAFPTETVYGLGGNALNPLAVKKIFRLKGRPSDNPLIVHIARKNDIDKFIIALPDIAAKLIAKFWPGPLTLVLRKNKRIPKETSGGLPTVAIRMPNHKIALQLIKKSGVPIAAPSANISGRPSPTSAEMVRKDFGNKVLVLEGGQAKIGLESTVLDCTGKIPVILRPGAITRIMIEKATGVKVSRQKTTELKHRSPGTRYRHYAPEAEVIIVKNHAAAVKTALLLMKSGKSVGIASNGHTVPKGIAFLKIPESHAGKARKLYSVLRTADRKKLDALIIEGVEKKDLGEAIMDRLERAARKL